MIALPEKLIQAFNAHMVKSGVPAHLQSHYRKWLWFYVDFCHKYRHPYSDAARPFCKSFGRQRATEKNSACKTRMLLNGIIGC
jgi:hypothetical protein